MTSHKTPKLTPKVTPITEEYEITHAVLGLGINGKVVECYSKATKEKYALKVCNNNVCFSLFILRFVKYSRSVVWWF